MPRGRNYYDPIVQVPGRIEDAEDKSRIELFPVGQDSTSRPPTDIGKWVGRRIAPDGSIAEYAPGDFDHDRALANAQALWPALMVYEVSQEIQDSTWDGTGPSPRLWQSSPPETGVAAPLVALVLDEPSSDSSMSEAGGERFQMRAFSVEAGTYLMLDDVLALLKSYAGVYDADMNPSAALALREAARALREPF